MESLIANLRRIENIDTKALERAIQSSRDALRKRENELLERETVAVDETGVQPKTLVPGEKVLVRSLNSLATVLKKPDSKGNVQIQAGAVKLFVQISDLRIPEKAEAEQKIITRPREIMTDIKSLKYELDLRGKLVSDAVIEIDAFIDQCSLAGRTEFNIIHGKGTGALRKGVHEFLKSHPKVNSYRIGNYGEGDAGVTVVTLKG